MKAVYTVKAFATHTLLTARKRYRVQGEGRFAAISIPTPEMYRLLQECGGDLERLLGPARMALKESGFTDVFILPAQTTVVELIPTDEPQHVLRDEPRDLMNELLSVIRVLDSHVQRVLSTGKLDKEFVTAYTMFARKSAECEVEEWRSTI